MVSDKTFRVVVIGLLILILGAIVGSFLSEGISQFVLGEGDDFLEFDEDLVFLEEDMLMYSFNSYSLDEFSSFTHVSLDSEIDLIEYGESRGFEVEEEDEFVFLFKEEDCDVDSYGREICVYEEIFYSVEEDLVEHMIEGFIYDE
ncbi:hypothetical protein HOC01_03690 [archaeon]|jgi:hypothetical protein|nr:hypothetical protein [archaeon]MBT6698486.1 hypothetical protein [archaeon]